MGRRRRAEGQYTPSLSRRGVSQLEQGEALSLSEAARAALVMCEVGSLSSEQVEELPSAGVTPPATSAPSWSGLAR